MQLHIIEQTGENPSITKALGISDERLVILEENYIQVIDKADETENISVPEVLRQVGEIAETPEELAYISIQYGAYVNTIQTPSPYDVLASAMGLNLDADNSDKFEEAKISNEQTEG